MNRTPDNSLDRGKFSEDGIFEETASNFFNRADEFAASFDVAHGRLVGDVLRKTALNMINRRRVGQGKREKNRLEKIRVELFKEMKKGVGDNRVLGEIYIVLGDMELSSFGD